MGHLYGLRTSKKIAAKGANEEDGEDVGGCGMNMQDFECKMLFEGLDFAERLWCSWLLGILKVVKRWVASLKWELFWVANND